MQRFTLRVELTIIALAVFDRLAGRLLARRS
jgi:hypothetical protein